MENELAVLQAVRLKGRPAPSDVAAATGIPEGDAESALGSLTEGGSLKDANGRYMLDAAGKDRLAQLLDEERAGLDADAIKPLYDEFDGFNSELKEIVTAWQLRDGEPNDHSDADYDQGIVDKLGELHGRFAPLVDRMVAAVPRLAPYSGRFTNAIEKLQGGDHSWIAKPLADSYHTVWFELHEELIGVLGLSREAEAASGRAE